VSGSPQHGALEREISPRQQQAGRGVKVNVGQKAGYRWGEGGEEGSHLHVICGSFICDMVDSDMADTQTKIRNFD